MKKHRTDPHKDLREVLDIGRPYCVCDCCFDGGHCTCRSGPCHHYIHDVPDRVDDLCCLIEATGSSRERGLMIMNMLRIAALPETEHIARDPLQGRKS